MNHRLAKERYILSRRSEYLDCLVDIIEHLPDHFDHEKQYELDDLKYDYNDVADPGRFLKALKDALPS